jgi:hypothetical protein
MDITNYFKDTTASNNNTTNNYALPPLLTNAFNRCVCILSDVSSYLPSFSTEINSNFLYENNTDTDCKKTLIYLGFYLIGLQINLKRLSNNDALWDEFQSVKGTREEKIKWFSEEIDKTIAQIEKQKNGNEITYDSLTSIQIPIPIKLYNYIKDNNATNSYTATTLLTNAFNRCVVILSDVLLYLPFSEATLIPIEPDTSYSFEDDTNMED